MRNELDMIIQYADAQSFYEGITALWARDLPFEADAESFTIHLR